ncbi:WAS/WASL-interacting protein family member 3-like [Pithys albifrons albifrons]|uniref:WAS/WASL-interacting protein family member 3-like n=1 Tax=Pithys albifrons albifrons TaxID=3385563 RepID=UPI003A5CA8D0
MLLREWHRSIAARREVEKPPTIPPRGNPGPRPLSSSTGGPSTGGSAAQSTGVTPEPRKSLRGAAPRTGSRWDRGGRRPAGRGDGAGVAAAATEGHGGELEVLKRGPGRSAAVSGRGTGPERIPVPRRGDIPVRRGRSGSAPDRHRGVGRAVPQDPRRSCTPRAPAHPVPPLSPGAAARSRPASPRSTSRGSGAPPPHIPVIVGLFPPPPLPYAPLNTPPILRCHPPATTRPPLASPPAAPRQETPGRCRSPPPSAQRPPLSRPRPPPLPAPLSARRRRSAIAPPRPLPGPAAQSGPRPAGTCRPLPCCRRRGCEGPRPPPAPSSSFSSSSSSSSSAAAAARGPRGPSALARPLRRGRGAGTLRRELPRAAGHSHR